MPVVEHGQGGAAVAEAPRKRKAREKTVKLPWGNRNEVGDLITKLTWNKGQSLPEGYDEAKHEPLNRSYFETMADYFQYRADTLLRKANEAQKAADDERSGVGKQIKATQKKFLKVKENFEALLKELVASGADVSALMPKMPGAEGSDTAPTA